MAKNCTKKYMLGLFTDIEWIGSGCQSRIFKAMYNDKNVVIKEFMLTSAKNKGLMKAVFVEHELDEEIMRVSTLKKISNEYNTMITIEHLKVYGFYTNSARAWLVFDFLVGEPLEKLYVSKAIGPVLEDAFEPLIGNMSPEKSLEFLKQICEFLIIARDKGFVHGDIRPWNILEADNTFKLIDWGSSINLDNPPSAPLDVSIRLGVTSPFLEKTYKSPRTRKVLKNAWLRNDLWGLGASVYNMVAEVDSDVLFGNSWCSDPGSDNYNPLESSNTKLNYIVNEMLLDINLPLISLEDVLDRL